MAAGDSRGDLAPSMDGPRRVSASAGAQEKAAHRRVGAQADRALARRRARSRVPPAAARWASAAQYGW